MLAISVREAIRDAVHAFAGAAAADADIAIASPATPERVFFATKAARAAGRARPVLR
jgi:xanthine dehydrogenase molybdopterin-binding subunit B